MSLLLRIKPNFALLLAFLVTVFFSLFFTGTSRAQAAADISAVRVEELTEEQIRQVVSDMDASGISDEQFERVALQAGMSPVELVKLKARIQAMRKLTGQSAGQKPLNNAAAEKQPLASYQSVLTGLQSKNFGAGVFNNARISFEPNLSLPTPRNYVLAANDELQIDVSGISEANYKTKISPDGLIRIPVAGALSVSGLTIEEARRNITRRLSSTIYSSIKTGRTQVDVSLAAIRSIRVSVIGEATVPGTYTLPALATAYHALYACGGPNNNGSFRDIAIIRAGKKITSIDVYQYLSEGNKSGDIQLRDGDIVRINGYTTRIELKGEVKKPGVYDVLPNETFERILTYAGGFTDNAYTARVSVYRNTRTERKVTTVSERELSSTTPQKGDVYIVGKILNRFSNRVSISGAIYRPGDYELKPDMTLTQLITEADGIREDAFLSRATIHRLKDDLSPQLESVDLQKLLGNQVPDIVLRKEDRITIYSKFDLKEGYFVKIDGEVSSPGSYLFEEGMTIEDLVLLSGGLKESSSLKRVEVSRRIKDSSTSFTENTRTALIYQQEMAGSLRDSLGFGRFVLQPFDEITVRTAPGYFVQKNVVIEGEVLYAGKYTLEAKSDRISDLVRRAGGFTPFAYLKGAVLVRTRNFNRTEQANYEQGLKNLVKQNLQAGTPANLVQAQVLDVIEKKSDFVGIDLERIMDDPKSEYDLFLNDGDTLRISKQLQTVRVSGEVLYPTLLRYDPNLRFKNYVLGAGGFNDRSSRKRSYVVYPNGSVQGTKSFLFFKNYPSVTPGAEVYVPLRRERERLRTGEVITIGATLVSMLAIVFSVLR